jgi:hypothetical protein
MSNPAPRGEYRAAIYVDTPQAAGNVPEEIQKSDFDTVFLNVTY